MLEPDLALPKRACYAVQVKDVTSENFGLLIAYVLPGFILLWSLAPYSITIAGWLGQATGDQPTVGGFLYVTLASVGLGQFVSTLRWLVMDSLHHATGIRRPSWSFSQLRSREAIAAFDRFIEDHYRYYQFHANGLMALTLAAILRWASGGFVLFEAAVVLLCNVLLFLGSRDTLMKYYRRVESVLSKD